MGQWGRDRLGDLESYVGFIGTGQETARSGSYPFNPSDQHVAPGCPKQDLEKTLILVLVTAKQKMLSVAESENLNSESARSLVGAAPTESFAALPAASESQLFSRHLAVSSR